MTSLRRLLYVALFAVPSFAGAADYRYCTTCHGATGNGNAAIQAPSLAGIEPWYLAAQLAAYRSHDRGRDWSADAPGTEMRTVAREIAPEQIADITREVASFRRESQAPLVAGDARSGRKQYATYCAACHGARGEGNASLQAPALARLNDWYLVSSFGKYRAGTRGADAAHPAAVSMRAAVSALPAQVRIEDIARYLRSLP